MRIAAAALAMALVGAPLVPAQSADPAPAETFAQRALKAGRIHASLARLASVRSKTPEIKRFAEALASDYDTRNARLVQLVPAETRAQSLAERAMVYSSTHDIPLRTREFHRLRVRDGAALDKQLLKAAILGCENAIRGYETAARSEDAEMRALAADSLPRFRRRLAEAQRLLDALE
jgi:putative membrane protein